jgi:DNA-binding HxlR family transcriptional regulator
MALGTDYPHQDCSLARALEVVGERWSLLIIRDAFYGVSRFNDFLVHLDLPKAVLTARLNSLVEAQVLAKIAYQQSPPRYKYVLTESGRSLWPVVYGLAQWGFNHVSGGMPKMLFSHTPCGSRLDAFGGCPACGGPVPPEAVTMQQGPGADEPMRQDPVSQALVQARPLLTPLAVDRPSRRSDSRRAG